MKLLKCFYIIYLFSEPGLNEANRELLEKEMATHSSVLAWRIPGTEEPGGLPSMGSHRVRHDWSELAAAAAATGNCARKSRSEVFLPWSDAIWESKPRSPWEAETARA